MQRQYISKRSGRKLCKYVPAGFAGISKAKLHRYTAEEIIALNQYRADDYTRECKVCKRIGQVDEKGVCPLCRKIEALSGNVLYDTFFSIVLEGEQEGLPLPGDTGW